MIFRTTNKFLVAAMANAMDQAFGTRYRSKARADAAVKGHSACRGCKP